MHDSVAAAPPLVPPLKPLRPFSPPALAVLPAVDETLDPEEEAVDGESEGGARVLVVGGCGGNGTPEASVAVTEAVVAGVVVEALWATVVDAAVPAAVVVAAVELVAADVVVAALVVVDPGTGVPPAGLLIKNVDMKPRSSWLRMWQCMTVSPAKV